LISKIWKILTKNRNLAAFTSEKNSNFFFEKWKSFSRKKKLLKTQYRNLQMVQTLKNHFISIFFKVTFWQKFASKKYVSSHIQGFFYGFFDVAKVAIVQKTI
jgi:hypothetical protein